MGSRCHYPFSDRGGVRAHLRLPLASGRARLLSNPAATLKKTKSLGEYPCGAPVGGPWRSSPMATSSVRNGLGSLLDYACRKGEMRRTSLHPNSS